MAFTMPSDVRIAQLELRVRMLDVVSEWYAATLGFDVATDGDRARLTLGDGRFAIDLVEVPGTSRRPYPCTGLYHFALLVPDRPALGALLRRILADRLTLEGMSDHGVSEAIYLRDPEMNGIEVYHDRPMEVWPRDDGTFAMGADPLDLDGVLASAPRPAVLHPGTVVGHVHFHVPALGAAESFYAGTMGMHVTQRTYQGALFLAAGDYHHHVGANTWAPNDPVPPDVTGMLSCTWEVGGDDLEALVSHVDATGVTSTRHDGAVTLTDPAGIAHVVRAR